MTRRLGIESSRLWNSVSDMSCWLGGRPPRSFTTGPWVNYNQHTLVDDQVGRYLSDRVESINEDIYELRTPHRTPFPTPRNTNP